MVQAVANLRCLSKDPFFFAVWGVVRLCEGSVCAVDKLAQLCCFFLCRSAFSSSTTNGIHSAEVLLQACY
jgi:hypothetical protein